MDIFFDARHDNLISSLVDRNKIFDNYMELSCFAAVVGWQSPVEKIITKSKTAPESVFYNNDREGLVYTIGLIREKSSECLREDNIKTCWLHFQDAVTSGMSIIDGWMNELNTKSAEEVILLKMSDMAVKIKSELKVSSDEDEITEPLV